MKTRNESALPRIRTVSGSGVYTENPTVFESVFVYMEEQEPLISLFEILMNNYQKQTQQR